MNKNDKEYALKVFNENLNESLAGVYYTPATVNEMLDKAIKYAGTTRKGKGTPTINLPASFDTETTSTYYNGEKFATMYEWTIGFNGCVIIGRTYDELFEVLDVFTKRLELDGTKKTLTLFVHNLSFDFQFIRKHFTWVDYFARTERKPMFATTSTGIRFQDSYVLTGFSLEKTAENLIDYPQVNKKVGDLDYSLVRHSNTPLTKEEIGYCINDVCVVMADIATRMKQENWNISKIPLTATGYARRVCRDACMYGKLPMADKPTPEAKLEAYKNHKDIMSRLTITASELAQAKRAFAGGFTHANAWHVGDVLENLQSFDFTSSYPASMVAFKYPMSKGKLIEDDIANSKLRYYLDNYCCMFDVKFNNITAFGEYESYISASKCFRKTNIQENNGRVWSADMIATTITDVDFQIIERCYTWETMEIKNLRIYARGYLPTNYVKAILFLYEAKTRLKGVKGKEEEYNYFKALLNALYGMMVTDITGDEVVITNNNETGWSSTHRSIQECVDEYNESKSRFISYIWGVFVTAYSRRNLWTAILECKDDYVYSDTDSVKCLNYEAHRAYFEHYNEWITRQMEKACKYHGIDVNLTSPKTIKGKVKPLGVWDDEGTLDKFKTLGAKRYMYTQNGKLTVTIAGVNKYKTRDYLINVYKSFDKIFEAFTDEMYIPDTYILDNEEADASGKKTHTYIDNEITATIIDYQGTPLTVTELSSCHLEGAGYDLSISNEFATFIKEITKEKRAS